MEDMVATDMVATTARGPLMLNPPLMLMLRPRLILTTMEDMVWESMVAMDMVDMVDTDTL